MSNFFPLYPKQGASTPISYRYSPEEFEMISQHILPGETIHQTARRLSIERIALTCSFWHVEEREIEKREDGGLRIIHQMSFEKATYAHKLQITHRSELELVGIPYKDRGQYPHVVFTPLSVEENKKHTWYQDLEQGRPSYITLDQITLWRVVEIPIQIIQGQNFPTLRCLRVDPFIPTYIQQVPQTMEIYSIARGDDGFWYISPLSAMMNGRYLIRCQTEEEAERLRSAMSRGNVPTPLADRRQYDVAAIHINGSTPIYEKKK